MAKFHITEQGPAPCTAVVRPCPYGGESGAERFRDRYEKEFYDASFNTRTDDAAGQQVVHAYSEVFAAFREITGR